MSERTKTVGILIIYAKRAQTIWFSSVEAGGWAEEGRNI